MAENVKRVQRPEALRMRGPVGLVLTTVAVAKVVLIRALLVPQVMIKARTGRRQCPWGGQGGDEVVLAGRVTEVGRTGGRRTTVVGVGARRGCRGGWR